MPPIKKTLTRLQKQVQQPRGAAKPTTQGHSAQSRLHPKQEEVDVDDLVENNGEETPAMDPDELLEAAANSGKDISNPEPGTYPAIVEFVKWLEPTEKGRSIQMGFVLFTGEEKNPIRRYSKFFPMFRPDLRTFDEWGPMFYGRFMGKLGYPDGQRGAAAMEEITENKPAITLRISPDKKNDSFVVPEITGRLDDENEDIQTIMEYLQNQPY